MSTSSISDLESLSDFSPSDIQIEKKIGEGYFSNVFVVTNLSIGEKMVQKEMKPGRDETQLKNEMKILRNLEHPNVLCFYGEIIDSKRMGVEAGLFQFCSGGDLSKKLEKEDGGRLDLELVKKYTTELVIGVDYLHSKMILHRDLKAENIFFDQKDSLKIGDFGAAVKITPEVKLTQLEGSPINLSPEMIKSEGYSFPRDWWSVGIIIFQMTVGEMPFKGATELELYMSILLNPPVFPENVEIDENLKKMVFGLLQKNSETRFGSGDIFGDAWMNFDWEDDTKLEIDSTIF